MRFRRRAWRGISVFVFVLPLAGQVPVAKVTDKETITVTDTPRFGSDDSEPIALHDAYTVTALIDFAGPAASFSTAGIGFNGNKAVTQTLTLSNVGLAPLVFSSSPAISTGFSITQVGCSGGVTSFLGSLASGGACTLTISWAGTPSTGTIVFIDNAALSNPASTKSGSNFTQSISLNGAGNGTGALGPPSATVTVADNETITEADTTGVKILLAQTITFGPLSDQALGSSPPPLSATASSGLTPVTFVSNTPSVCTVSGTTVTIVESGGCSITAIQLGNATYAPAPLVTQDFTVLFSDISPSASYAAAVDLFAQYGITAGCGKDDFCANGLVTRADMAIFIITGIFRSATFSYSSTPHFADVPSGSFGFKWIQAMYELGITAGCGGGNYCPNSSVTREEMAVFLIIARFGTGASFTYSSTPDFADVPDSGGTASYFKFVQRMKQDGITAGCAKAVAPATLPTYCPGEAVTRAQMAVFMMAGLFNFPLPPTAPAITAINPSTLAAGASGTFTITGVNTTFTQGVTTLNPVPGVTIGAITVSSPTSLTVQLTAAAGATARPYTIVAITNSEQDVLPNSLVIQ